MGQEINGRQFQGACRVENPIQGPMEVAAPQWSRAGSDLHGGHTGKVAEPGLRRRG
jgi:hypothetical protein